MDEVRQNINALLSKQSEIEQKVDSFKENISKEHRLLDNALNENGKQRKEIYKIKKSLSKLNSKGVPKEQVDAMIQQLGPIEESIRDINKAYEPETGR